MKSKFLNFIKFLIVVAIILNLLFLFVFDGRIPSGIQLPFSLPTFQKENADTEETAAEEEAVEESDAENIVFEAEKAEEEQAEVPEEPVEEEAVQQEPVQRCTIVSEGGSNIRSGPGVDYEVVTSYAYNTVLIVTGNPENGWYPIQAEDGTTGYIFETQISMLEDETPAEGDGQVQTQY